MVTTARPAGQRGLNLLVVKHFALETFVSFFSFQINPMYFNVMIVEITSTFLYSDRKLKTPTCLCKLFGDMSKVYYG